jgi:DNA-binding PadR family transcriptional regulator
MWKMAVTRDLFLGFIQLHILHHAGREPVYGLWLIEELARHGYALSPGTLYPILHKLEKQGLLVGERQVVLGKVRKCYRLTPIGQVTLDEGRTRAAELMDEIVDGEV